MVSSSAKIILRLLNNNSNWLMQKTDCTIVLSSRIRLARNIERYPFPIRANKEDLFKVRDEVFSAVVQFQEIGDKWILNMEDLSDMDRQFLVERHLISYEHTVDGYGKGVIITPDETVSIMVNEEDHLRIQVVSAGFDLDKVWGKIDFIDDNLSSLLEYSFSPRFGYLTSCPTNTGTAMRASLMMHLPALVITNQINRVLQTITKLNFTARGLYGEGTQALGNVFQISNQASLGYTEQELVDGIKRIGAQIIDQEQMARDKILKTSRIMIEDRIWRAYGLLRNARIMNSAEALEYLSMLRLGRDMGLIEEVDSSIINSLAVIIQPAHLQKINGRRLSSRQRDIKRAKILRERLAGGK